MAKPAKRSKRKTTAQPLDARKVAFVTNFVAGMGQTKAYIAAGYSPRGASAAAARLMAQPAIQAYLKIIRDEATRRAQALSEKRGAAVSAMLQAGLEGAATSRRVVDASEQALRAALDHEVALTLTSDYIDTLLIEAAEKASGRKPTRKSYVTKCIAYEEAEGSTPAAPVFALDKNGEKIPKLDAYGDPIFRHVVEIVDIIIESPDTVVRVGQVLYQRADQAAGRPPQVIDGEVVPMSDSAGAAYARFREVAGLAPDPKLISPPRRDGK